MYVSILSEIISRVINFEFLFNFLAFNLLIKRSSVFFYVLKTLTRIISTFLSIIIIAVAYTGKNRIRSANAKETLLFIKLSSFYL